MSAELFTDQKIESAVRVEYFDEDSGCVDDGHAQAAERVGVVTPTLLARDEVVAWRFRRCRSAKR